MKAETSPGSRDMKDMEEQERGLRLIYIALLSRRTTHNVHWPTLVI